MLADGELNWGRIVALFAFSAHIAKHCYAKDGGSKSHVDDVAQYLAEYINDNLSARIRTSLGGWVSRVCLLSLLLIKDISKLLGKLEHCILICFTPQNFGGFSPASKMWCRGECKHNHQYPPPLPPKLKGNLQTCTDQIWALEALHLLCLRNHEEASRQELYLGVLNKFLRFYTHKFSCNI